MFSLGNRPRTSQHGTGGTVVDQADWREGGAPGNPRDEGTWVGSRNEAIEKIIKPRVAWHLGDHAVYRNDIDPDYAALRAKHQ
jgi:hypothetical protein